MKKIILSAVMMMAFVGTSFGKSEEIQTASVVLVGDPQPLPQSSCGKVGSDAEMAVLEGGGSAALAEAVYTATRNSCIKNTGNK